MTAAAEVKRKTISLKITCQAKIRRLNYTHDNRCGFGSNNARENCLYGRYFKYDFKNATIYYVMSAAGDVVLVAALLVLPVKVAAAASSTV